MTVYTFFVNSFLMLLKLSECLLSKIVLMDTICVFYIFSLFYANVNINLSCHPSYFLQFMLLK